MFCLVCFVFTIMQVLEARKLNPSCFLLQSEIFLSKIMREEQWWKLWFLLSQGLLIQSQPAGVEYHTALPSRHTNTHTHTHTHITSLCPECSLNVKKWTNKSVNGIRLTIVYCFNFCWLQNTNLVERVFFFKLSLSAQWPNFSCSKTTKAKSETVSYSNFIILGQYFLNISPHTHIHTHINNLFMSN